MAVNSVDKAISYDDEEREGFRFGGRSPGRASRRGKRGSGPSKRGRGGPRRGKRGSGPSKRGRGGPKGKKGSGPSKRGRGGPTKKSSPGPTKKGRLGPTKTPSQRQPGLTKTAAQKSAEKAYNKKTAFRTTSGGFLKDSKGNIVRSKTQVAKEGAKRAQERALRQLVAPSIQAGEAKQVTPTDSSIRAVAEAQKESMSAFNKQRTPEQLNKLATLNRAMGLNPTSGMGIMNSLKYNVTNPEFKRDVKQAGQILGSLPTPMNILRRIGTGLLTDFGGIKDAVTGAQKSQRQPGLFASEKDSKGLFGGMGEGIGNLFSGLRIGPSDAGSQRRGGDRRALNRDGSLSSAAAARDAAPVLSTPAADPVNQTTGAIDYSNAMASSPVLTTPAASPATLPTMATQGTPYRLRDYYAGILGQNPAMYAAEGGRVGFQDGGLNRLRAEYGFTPLSEDQLSGGWSQQAADLTGLFDRRYGGYSGDLSYAYGKGFDPQATKSALAKKLGTTDIREQGQDMQRYNKALNEIKAEQLKNVRDVEASYGLSVSDKERDLIRNALGGQFGVLAGGTVATGAEAFHNARRDNYMAMRNLSKYLETSDLGDRLSQAIGPEEMIEAAPVSAQAAVTPAVAPSATPTEASPTITTPAAVTPAAVTPAAVTPAAETAPVLQSFNPMTYQTSYTTPTVADPTTNMSQYYSDVLSTPYFDFNSSAFNTAPAADTAANVASQYLNPQEAQLYVPNPYEKGGRVGFNNGGITSFQEALTALGQQAYNDLIDQGKSHDEAVGSLERMERNGAAFLPNQKMAIFNSESNSPFMTENPSWKRTNERYGGRVGRMHGGMMIMGDDGVVNNGIGGILSKYKEIRSELQRFMDGLWLSDKILRLIRDKKEQTTQFVMQGSTTERQDYNFMIGKFRVLEELENDIKEILDKGEKND